MTDLQSWHRTRSDRGVPAGDAPRRGARLALIALLVVSGLMMFLATACDAAESSGGAKKVEATPTPVIPGVGTPLANPKDGWTITVQSVSSDTSTVSGLFSVAPKMAQGVFLLLKIDLTNTGTAKHALGSNRFKLHDSENRTFEPSTFIDVNNMLADMSFGTGVNPGLTITGLMSFDIPPNSKGLWLETVGKGRINLPDVENGKVVAPK